MRLLFVGNPYYTTTMIVKNDHVDTVLNADNKELVVWGDQYATGIEVIDKQHKELVFLTNELYGACLAGRDVIDSAFKEAMSRMVEYVRFHFTAELKLLEQIKYPDYDDHKRQHDSLVRNILEAAKDFDTGKKFVPHSFVRTLKDWVFGHIAVSDKSYAAYVQHQKRFGRISDSDLEISV